MAFMVLGCYCIQAIPQWLCCSAMGSAECGRPCILAPSWWRYAAWIATPGDDNCILQSYRKVTRSLHDIFSDQYRLCVCHVWNELSVGLEHVTVSMVSKDMAEVIGGLTALIANSRTFADLFAEKWQH